MNSKQRRGFKKQLLKIAKGLNSEYIKVLEEVKAGDSTIDEAIKSLECNATILKEIS